MMAGWRTVAMNSCTWPEKTGHQSITLKLTRYGVARIVGIILLSVISYIIIHYLAESV